MTRQCKVYISGPISGNTNYIDSFEKAGKHLKNLGYLVVDPSVIDPPAQEGEMKSIESWQYYMREGIKRLMDCNRIYMLEGWENSEGAMLEQRIALQLGMPCLYEVEEGERV